MSAGLERKIRIGLLNRHDPRSVLSWSGLLFFMARALEKHVGDVVYLGPDDTYQTKFLFDMLYRVNRVMGLATGKRLAGEHNRICSMRLGSFFRSQLRDANVDILFAPAASIEIAHLDTQLPIIYLSDTAWKDIFNYYSDFSSLSSFGRREGDDIERRAITKARAVVYPSEWPMQSAHQYYGAPREKIFSIPFGANLEETPPRQRALQHRFTDTIELLWIGVDWERKGGAIAFDCLLDLLKSGADARLTTCGCTPPKEFAHPRLRIFNFLNKHDPEQRKMLSELFFQAHFFLFPTRAEAFGLVVAEASAHGLPSLATDTGGVSGVLREGENGFMMPPAASGRDYAGRIRAILASPDGYRDLVHSSRELFERRLNWDAWGASIRPIFLQALSNRVPG